MGMMPNQEKVLHGLDSCGFYDGIPNICEVTECPYRDDKCGCVHELAHDAGLLISELLKAQEPRVMIWQDVIGAVIQCKPLYIEMKDIDYEEPGGNRWVMMTQYGDSLTNGMICAMSSYITRETLFKDWYNKTWRCWTAEPSDEQRRAEPWEY